MRSARTFGAASKIKANFWRDPAAGSLRPQGYEVVEASSGGGVCGLLCGDKQRGAAEVGMAYAQQLCSGCFFCLFAFGLKPKFSVSF